MSRGYSSPLDKIVKSRRMSGRSRANKICRTSRASFYFCLPTADAVGSIIPPLIGAGLGGASLLRNWSLFFSFLASVRIQLFVPYVLFSSRFACAIGNWPAFCSPTLCVRSDFGCAQKIRGTQRMGHPRSIVVGKLPAGHCKESSTGIPRLRLGFQLSAQTPPKRLNFAPIVVVTITLWTLRSGWHREKVISSRHSALSLNTTAAAGGGCAPKGKNQEPRTKNQELRAKNQEPHSFFLTARNG